MKEPYRDAHDRSNRRKNTRTDEPKDLGGYVRWANRLYEQETPTLDHSQAETDDGGAPQMKAAARAWVGLNGQRCSHRECQRDRFCLVAENDWRKIACRVDEDGYFVTPVRCAIESMEPYRRSVLRAVVPHLFDIVSAVHAALGPMPEQAALDTAEASLRLLWRAVQDRPLPRPRKLNHLEKSDSQIAAEDAA